MKNQMGISKKPIGRSEDAPYRSLQEYFERVVDENPKRCAVEYESKTLSYEELNFGSNQIAHYLRGLGVKKNAFVGILMDRSIEMVMSILGVLKAGGAFVPLDPEYPEERLKFLVNEIEAPVILTLSELSQKFTFPTNNTKIVCLDGSDKTKIEKLSGENPVAVNGAGDAAYMIYTSGSTGLPKGCVNTHEGVANYLLWVSQEQFPLQPGEKVLFKSSFTFDAALVDIFWPLFSGGTLVIAKPDGHKDTRYILESILDKKISHIGFVPSMLQLFLEEEGIEKCSSIRCVLSAGEALHGKTVSDFYRKLPKARLFNLYGPTEAGIGCIGGECPKVVPVDSVVAIGKPLPNNKIYIVDEASRMVTQGQPGELCIGGVQVSKGYWKRDALTKEKFVTDPFSGIPGARMYRTGDRARYLSDGTIEFLGRIDLQVKIRGFRIELGEIESVLNQDPSIKQAVVVAKHMSGKDQEASLVAYVVMKDPKVNTADLKNKLRLKVPNYMVPAVFVKLDKLPTISSDKIDRRSLLEKVDDTTAENHEGPAPTLFLNEAESKIATVWEEVLKTKVVNLKDNFYTLGGDSLKLIRVRNKLKGLGYEVSLPDMFTYTTISELAAFAIKGKHNKNGAQIPPLENISKSRSENKFDLSFEQEEFGGTPKELVEEAPWRCHISFWSGKLNVQALKKSVEMLVERQWTLRTRFVVDGKRACQAIDHFDEKCWREIDLRKLNDAEKENAIQKTLGERCSGGVKLTDYPLIRFDLIRSGDNEYYFSIAIPQIIFDETSRHILNKELLELYSAQIEGRPAHLSPLPVQYVDYATWQKKYLNEAPVEKIEFWKTIIRNSRQLNLPFDFSLPEGGLITELRQESLEPEGGLLDKEFLDKLEQWGRARQATLSQIFQCAYTILLHRLTHQNEIAFQVYISQKPTEMENVMGCSVSRVIYFINYSQGLSFNEVLEKVKKAHLDVQANLLHTVQWSKLIPTGRPMDVTKALLNIVVGEDPYGPVKLPGVESEAIEVESFIDFQHLSCRINVAPTQASYFIEGNRSLFKQETILEMAKEFKAILDSFITGSNN